MSYNLYTDKPNKFSCNIDVEGTSLSNSKVRLVIETDELSYVFNGKIENTGVCEVTIPKTKNFLTEGSKGNIKLEVIADDVFFEPWSSDFSVKTSKKVNVVVQEQHEERPKLRVTVNEQNDEPKKEEPVKPKIQEVKKTTDSSKKTVILTKAQMKKVFKGF